MDRKTWLQQICKMFNCKNHRKRTTCAGYLPVSLFLVFGRFSNQNIDNIMDYGGDFIKHLKY
jgi:hypothetical protein